MEDNIKLIWDFHGPDAQRTAEHHAIHLKEFASREGINTGTSGVESINDKYSIAYLVVSRDKMILVRDALKPHRGELI